LAIIRCGFYTIYQEVLKCNADIHFNKTCLAHKIIPKYANIKIKTAAHSEAARLTEKQTRTLRIKNEIKYLYKKKQQLNKQMYSLHIENANIWGNLWHIISNNINNTLESEMKQKYNNINNEINKGKEQQQKE
jgi:phage terminase Nu1 subunit (DNA packaging protein)